MRKFPPQIHQIDCSQQNTDYFVNLFTFWMFCGNYWKSSKIIFLYLGFIYPKLSSTKRFFKSKLVFHHLFCNLSKITLQLIIQSLKGSEILKYKPPWTHFFGMKLAANLFAGMKTIFNPTRLWLGFDHFISFCYRKILVDRFQQRIPRKDFLHKELFTIVYDNYHCLLA